MNLRLDRIFFILRACMNNSYAVRAFRIRFMALVRITVISLLGIAAMGSIHSSAAAGISDQNGRPVKAAEHDDEGSFIAWYCDANGNVIKGEELAGVDRRIQRLVKNKKELRQRGLEPPAVGQFDHSLGADPGFDSEVINLSAFSYAVYIGVDREQIHWTIAGYEDLQRATDRNGMREIKVSRKDPPVCPPGKVCIPCFGGCCCR
jgi:hypothetical protein